MIKGEDFTARVNYAAKCISAGKWGGRAFSGCCEWGDGDAVVVALYRRSLKNPKLAANLFRALCEHATMRAVAEWAHVPARHMAYGARAAREGNGEAFRAMMAGAHMLSCDECGRWLTDESPELAADMLNAHKAIAHKPEPEAERIAELEDEGLTHSDAAAVLGAEALRAEPLPDSSANVIAFRPRAEFRAPTPDEPEPSPTGTDGGASTAEPCAHAERESFTCPAEGGREIGYTQCSDCGKIERAEPRALTATAPMLRALKLINDANVLAERQKDEGGKVYGRDDCALVRLGRVVAVINVAKLDKWVSTFEPGAVFSFELTGDALTLTNGTSFIRFERQQYTPTSSEAIDLTCAESGEVSAPALPSPEEMKAARKRLAAGRKELKRGRERVKALQSVNAARAEVRRAEEWAGRLEDEARAAIARAEELTEEDCDEAVMLARRVRDLRRLHRAVEQAAEDPQVNTPEFFEWLTDEYQRAVYAGAFAKYEKARIREGNFNPPYSYQTWKANAATRKRFATQTENARKACGAVLWSAFNEHTRAEVREIAGVTPEEIERDGEVMPDYRARETVFGMKSRMRRDNDVQATKRTLRQLPARLAEARARITDARARVVAALLDYEPRVTEPERETFERLLNKYGGPRELALAA